MRNSTAIYKTPQGVFKSMNEVASAYNITREAVRQRFHSFTFADWIDLSGKHVKMLTVDRKIQQRKNRYMKKYPNLIIG